MDMPLSQGHTGSITGGDFIARLEASQAAKNLKRPVASGYCLAELKKHLNPRVILDLQQQSELLKVLDTVRGLYRQMEYKPITRHGIPYSAEASAPAWSHTIVNATLTQIEADRKAGASLALGMIKGFAEFINIRDKLLNTTAPCRAPEMAAPYSNFQANDKG